MGNLLGHISDGGVRRASLRGIWQYAWSGLCSKIEFGTTENRILMGVVAVKIINFFNLSILNNKVISLDIKQ